jgi:hypothetical protein
MSGNSNDDNVKDTTNKTNYHTSYEDYKEEDEKERNSLVPTKAKEVGQSLKEKVKSAGKKTIAKTEKKTKELNLKTNPCRPQVLVQQRTHMISKLSVQPELKS